jgi:integrase
MARGKGIYRRGSVYWICYSGFDGKMRFESSKSTKYADAEVLLTTRRKGVQEGRDDAPRRIKPCTFAELSVDYLAWAQRQKSVRGKKAVVNRLVRDFGNLPLSRFTTHLVEEYQTRLLNEGKQSMTTPTGGKKPATINRYICILRHMIRRAHEWERCGEEAVKRVRLAKNLPENNKRLRYLSVEEVNRLIAKSADHIKPVITAAIHTGLRMGNILSLTWDQVDLRNNLILIPDSKTGIRLEIPINAILRAALDGIPRHLTEPHVFLNDGKPIKNYRTAFLGAVKRAGIKDFQARDMRHCFASFLRQGGVELGTVKDLLGHQSISMTMRYAHIGPTHAAKAVGVLDNAFRIVSSNLTVTLQSPSESLLEAPSAIASS